MDSDRYARCSRATDQKYNVDRQLLEIMNATDDALELLWDIRLFLDLGEDFQAIIAFLNPPLDPLQY
jgi:hypothetical protein